MDISAIRDEAPHARRQLMEGVERRCLLFGIEEGAARDAGTVEGRILSADERRQRKELLGLQDEVGHDELVERAAYTWFDRLLAIRFMEANDRLPSHVRVLLRTRRLVRPGVPPRGARPTATDPRPG